MAESMTLAKYKKLKGGGKPKPKAKATPKVDYVAMILDAIAHFNGDCEWTAILEYKFHPDRKWKLDIAWPSPHKLGVEIHGGVHVQGRHTRGVGFCNDRKKINAAIMLRWRVLEYPTDEIRKRPLEVAREIIEALSAERYK